MNMTLNELTYLISVLNQLVDAGHHTGVTLDEVEDRIEYGDLFPWLGKRFADHHIDFHLSIYDRATLNEIENGLFDICAVNRGRERRKWGIEKNGICLLSSWVSELIQRRAWKDEHANMELSQ
jgi:hypothetical protein